MYDNKNIVLHELIGLKAEVVACRDASQKGTRGVVVDETKNTLVLLTKAGPKRVGKRISTFKFIADKKVFTVQGEEITFRPYERIEKSMKYYKRRRL